MTHTHQVHMQSNVVAYWIPWMSFLLVGVVPAMLSKEMSTSSAEEKVFYDYQPSILTVWH